MYAIETLTYTKCKIISAIFRMFLFFHSSASLII
nr:MAG TPA: hypothetical protein [Caudoviricetes sp.]DAT29510.1 MAG TPA: hypothetical protein [Caudoviricetes sp.]DAU08853.1 MAG TPA: hypothetical protein [Caudoviricetes sp.]